MVGYALPLFYDFHILCNLCSLPHNSKAVEFLDSNINHKTTNN